MSDEIDIDDDKLEENNEWLTTFADLSLLLLVFFILLFSLSTLDPSKFQDSFGSIKGAMGGDATSSPSMKDFETTGAQYEQVKMRKQLIEAQRQAFNEIRSFLVQNGMEGQVGAVLDEGVITLRLPAQVLFEKYSEQLSPQSEYILKILYEIFVRRRDQNIDVRGYTDDTQPPANTRFKDNWELSALRAVSVLRYLLAQGIEPTRLTATGFGPLEPIMMNTTEENRARNRRVEFILYKRITGGGGNEHQR